MSSKKSIPSVVSNQSYITCIIGCVWGLIKSQAPNYRLTL